MRKLILVVHFVLAALWVAWPFVSAYRLKAASVAPLHHSVAVLDTPGLHAAWAGYVT